MKIVLILIALAAVVLLMEKFKSQLPTPLKQIYWVWEKFSHTLGIIMSWIILTVLWVVGFGAYAIIRKCIMPFKKKPATNTYWIDIEASTPDAMKHQF